MVFFINGRQKKCHDLFEPITEIFLTHLLRSSSAIVLTPPIKVVVTGLTPQNSKIPFFKILTPGRLLKNIYHATGASIVITRRADLPVRSFSGKGEFALYRKAKPGRKTRSMNPFRSAGNEAHQDGKKKTK